MYLDYYKQELRALYEMATEFGRQNPSVAGLLQEPSTDPDVERLLQGVAFLTADIRRKLDDEFPEIAQALVQSICPRYLRPTPAVTLMALTPRDNLKQTLRVPAGTMMDSVPIEGTHCRFRTCYDVNVAPIEITRIAWLENDTAQANLPLRLEIVFQTKGLALSSINLDSLRLHIAGEFGNATDLYQMIHHNLNKITLKTGRDESEIPKRALVPVGFSPEHLLLPNHDAELPAYILLQEYFQYPQKFLFFDLDLRAWRNRTDTQTFSVILECAPTGGLLPTLKNDTLLLHVTPAVNLFTLDAEPILYDHTQARTLLKPAGSAHSSVSIYSVDHVEGRARSSQQPRKYRAFSSYAPTAETDSAVYQLNLQDNPLNQRIDTYMSFSYGPHAALADKEIVIAHLTCCNGTLPERLMPGDIRVPTTNTPALIDFKNISAPSGARSPAVNGAILWQLLSHLSLNYLSIANAENIKALLTHYLLSGNRDRAQEMVNMRRIESIQDLRMSVADRLFGSAFVRGFEIRLSVRSDHFVSDGDKYLFGCLLDHFFGAQAAINCFTKLSFEDAVSGEELSWPTRLGTKLIL